MGIYILFVFLHVSSGSVLTTQEFYSKVQCDYAASLVNKEKDVVRTFCIKK